MVPAEGNGFVNGITLPRGRAGLPGRHLDVSKAAIRVARRLDPTAFAQTMLILCLVILIWPTSLGGRFGIVMVAGNSMEPTYMLGDAAITWRGPVEIGDTILFVIPDGEPGAGNLVIHRVVGGDVDGWITKGDNTAAIDRWTPSNRQVLGVAKFHIPLGGQVVATMGSWLFVALLGSLAVGLLLWPDGKDQAAGNRPTKRGRHKTRRLNRAVSV